MRGWSADEMKDKSSSSLEGDTEENADMEIFERRGDGSVVEAFGTRNAGKSSGQVQGRGQQKGGLQRQRLPAGMEACTKKQQ